MGNESYWDEKVENRGGNPLKPEEALVKSIRYLKSGTVLDLACGDGRNSLFLLKEGFNVTGVDFSIKALGRLHTFAAMNNYRVNTKKVDLSKADALDNIEKFDNIIINHYRLSKEQLSSIHKHLRIEGILFINGFGQKHVPDLKIREEDLIHPSDFDGLNENLELVKYNETIDERGSFVTYIYRKQGDLNN
ncbi:methyltransferase domain-containing protein [Clostridium sp.]|uniref:class I SAM-dependent methyltransferase n=1 Tax=Clostridium sp. TaxID=1506 RepID=UPI0025C6F872|nr:methyltransferase domain-containing protein [Clostridium sp.]